MRGRGRALSAGATALSACVALGFAMQSCGVTSSDDCAQRADCLATSEEAGGVDAPSAVDQFVEATLGDRAGPDGAYTGDVAGDCRAIVEDCTNGIDDNCDGLIDCADPECAAYACVPPVPTGWSGPIALATAAGTSGLPACQTGYKPLPLQANGGMNPAPPATCGTCTCGVLGQQCTENVFVNQSASSQCLAACPAAMGTTNGVCANLPDCGAGLGSSFSVALPKPSATGGSCVPDAGTTMVPQITWRTAAQLCAYQGNQDTGGCTTGSQCIQSPTGSFGTSACVYSTADPAPTACPTGYAGMDPVTFFQGVSDTRTCSPCTCSGIPIGGGCTGSIVLYGGVNCTGTNLPYTLDGTCQVPSLAPKPTSVLGAYNLTPGNCAAPSQPTPIGTASAAMPITVCCM